VLVCELSTAEKKNYGEIIQEDCIIQMSTVSYCNQASPHAISKLLKIKNVSPANVNVYSFLLICITSDIT